MSGSDDILEYSDSAVAIVGMACHLPGSLNIGQYWSNLRNGVESVKFFSDEELLAAGESPANLANPLYVRAQPVLENFDRFDASFWGFNPQDAAVTDPSHRIFLEVAYAALEHSGHTGYDSEGRVGVFASAGENLYRMRNLNSNPQLINEMGEFLVRHTGNCMNFLATRLSYELDLRGPSINVQTACSSGLVAVHMAAQNLLNGECDTAIVGGSTIVVPQGRGYVYTEGEIHSPDGHCRPFDINSTGTVFGSGAGAVILRRLDDALEDGDTIYAIVRGSAINNDGAQKVGFLAPGVEGQAGVLAEALEISGVEASDVSYIEAHGTGTLVGDPIEFEALNQVYRDATDKRAYCRVGSVKSNIGHLGESAGSASIIKVILALQNKEIPPTLNYTAPNKDINLNDSPFLIADKLEPWVSNGPRFAGITALGAGGTNAHVILQEAPKLETKEASTHSKQLLVLSAKTPTALQAASRNLAKALENQTDLDLADVAYTLQIGRRTYTYRRVIAANDKEEAIDLLKNNEASRVVDDKAENTSPLLVFMFPGGGAQYAGMGAELYASEAVYKQAFDDCLACIDASLAEKIKALVFAKNDDIEAASKSLETPSLTLPSLFATEYALTKQFLAWGAKPDAFIGHSMGEYTAACLSGVFSLNDAMQLVALRGKLFEKVATGGMLSVGLAEKNVRTYLTENLDIAAVNAADLCVVSGPVNDIEQLHKEFEVKGVDCTRVRIDVAAHSSMLESILEEFRTFCQTINFSKPEIPFTSNLSGKWMSDSDATDPNYWVKHLRSTVKFSDNVSTLLDHDNCVFVEIGPGRALTNLSQAGEKQAHATFNSMRHFNETASDVEFALRTFGHMWAAGVAIDWKNLWADEKRQRVALPSYPFERKTYWVEPGQEQEASKLKPDDLIKQPNLDDWFGRLSWAQSTCPPLKAEVPNTWLIFGDEFGLSNAMLDEIGSESHVIHVQRAERFLCKDNKHYQVNPANAKDMQDLFDSLNESGVTIQKIVYLWGLSTQDKARGSSAERLDCFDTDLTNYFWGLFNLSKAIVGLDNEVRLSVVTNGMQAIADSNNPEKALVLGPVNVLPHEMPNVNSQSIDISNDALSTLNNLPMLARQVVRELKSEYQDRIIAFRASDRWVQQVISTPLQVSVDKKPWLRTNATVLITGGLGGIGLTVAKKLSEKGAGCLILLGRKLFPSRDKWVLWLDQHASEDATAQRILAIQAIETTGTKVIVESIDVSDSNAMRQLIKKLKHEVGDIHGIIHAAGSIDDQLIFEKTEASAKSVLETKLKGALILDDNFANDELDFFVVFSSIASFLGLPGQIDYTAANAFLDAFSHERSLRSSGYTLAVNWNAWRDVGMVVNAQEKAENIPASAEKYKVEHPLISYAIDAKQQIGLYSSNFSAQSDWVIAEHCTKSGVALIPGTALVELCRAAFVEHCGSTSPQIEKNITVELSDVQFLTAFSIPADQMRTLHVEVNGNTQEAALNVYSEAEDMPHTLAIAKCINEAAPTKIELNTLKERCSVQITTQGKFLDQHFMNFGPRWGCVQSIYKGKQEALLDVDLSEQFISDLDYFVWHPAMMDMAIGGAQFLIDGFAKEHDFYVPIGYQRVVFYKQTPKHFFSHVSIKASTVTDLVSFDIVMFDESGQCFSKVEGFTMKKVADGFMSAMGSGELSGGYYRDKALGDILQNAMLPDEGLEVFDRVMGQQQQSQWIVSSVNAANWLEQLDSEKTETANKMRFVKEREHDPDADPDIKRIEQVFMAQDCLDEVVARAFIDQQEERRLVVFYTTQNKSPLENLRLQAIAIESLAENIQPNYYLHIEAFKYAQGLIDRSGLIDPLSADANYLAARTDTESAIANVWQEVLGLDRIGMDENFFELGGHSLLLIRITTRVNKLFDIKLATAKLYESATIELWAEFVEALQQQPKTKAKSIKKIARSTRRISDAKN